MCTFLLSAVMMALTVCAVAEAKLPIHGNNSGNGFRGLFVGMPNPVTEVKNDGEFKDRLGIKINLDELKDLEPEKRIIGNNVGEVSFVLENVNAEPVKWTLRFTKNKEFGKSPEAFSGVFDANMSKPTVTEVPLDGKKQQKTLKIIHYEAKTEKCQLYFWKLGDVYFSLTVNGDFSQMQYAAVMDRLIEVID